MDKKQLRKRKRVRENMFLRDGIWYFRKVVTDANGIKRRKAISTKQKDYELAKVAATELESKANKGELDTFIEKKKVAARPDARYATFAQVYIDEVSTFKRYKNALDNDKARIAPSMAFFGDVSLADITSERCRDFVRHLRALKSDRGTPYRPNVVINYVYATRMVIAEAIRRKLLTQDPWVNVNLRQELPRPTTRSRVVSLDEQRRFLADAGDEARRAFIVMVGSGLRLDELLNLEARHCDFDEFRIVLTGDIVKGKDRYNRERDVVAREIPMQPAVVQALKEQMDARAAGIGDYNRRRSGPWLWNMTRSALMERFGRAIEKAGIPHFTQHDCRRTFATRCAEAGVKPHKLQAWLGHGDISTTMKFYVHEQRKESRAEMLRLDIGLPDAPVPIAMRRKAVGD